jgi:hypothetical protein
MRKTNYARYAREHGLSVEAIRVVAEDQSFFDDSPEHGKWLDSCDYVEFTAWIDTAVEEAARQADED